ncbi:MAG TPA: DUF669 domain-containing protein [Candidatus Hydrogenedentes bacterium]|nr:DUF669 domain-containing protein [Candidatus Hydrogenedentota bacterium]HPG66522.1 DUF669 domain-containing protein [Candidatus Hydrogenedentota bacterium]
METNGYPQNEHEDIDLSQFDDDYESAEVEDREFEPVPDGKYQVKVDRVEIARAKSSGNPMLKWTLKILAPTHAGRLLWRNNVMASKENVKWLKNDLHVCGLELEKLSELPERLDDLLDLTLEVTKRTRGENENIYLNRRIEIDAGDSDGEPARDAKGEIIPF